MTFLYSMNNSKRIELNFRKLTVSGDVDFIRQFRHVHLEPVLNVVQYFCVRLVAHEGDGEPLGTETTRPGHLCQVSSFNLP